MEVHEYVLRRNGSASPPQEQFLWRIESRPITARGSTRAADRVANGLGCGAGVTGTMLNLMKILGQFGSLHAPSSPRLAPPGFRSAYGSGPFCRRARLTRENCLLTEEHGRVALRAWRPLCLESRSVGKARTKILC